MPGGTGPRWSRICSGVGRRAGSLARHGSASRRISSGTSVKSAAACTTLYSVCGAVGPVNGPRPVAAMTRIAPRENTSLAPVTCPLPACSGDMNAGDPMIAPVPVSSCASSATRAMPKSITLGPSLVRMTLLGLRSRWISPARWISVSAAASPDASRRTDAAGSGPAASTASFRDGPVTKTEASQGVSASASASMTAAVYAPDTSLEVATSRRNRSRNRGSCANWACSCLTATSLPSGARPSTTRPMPPSPISAMIRYGPTCRGSPGFNGFTDQP